MPKAKVTIHARLKVSREEKEILDDLMRRWSVCMRCAYKRLLEGKTRNKLKKEFQNIIKNIETTLVIARRELGFFEKIPKNYKSFLEKIEESLQCELKTVLGLTDGRNSDIAGKEKLYLCNPWQVVRVAGLTALSPGRREIPRCLSPLKRVFVSGEMGRTRAWHKALLPEAGPMDAQIPPAGAGHPEQRRITNTPAPNCINTQFG